VAVKQKVDNPRSDESVQGAAAQADALHFIGAHTNRILPVELARLGRAFALFHPLEQIRLDSTVETRPYRWALVGLGMYYALVALSVGGLIILRRRRIPILPLVAIGLDVCVSVALTFGQTRYRTTFEIALVMAAAVQLDWAWNRIWGRREGSGADSGSPDHRGDGLDGGVPSPVDPPDGATRGSGPGPSGLVTPVPTG
jgi:hypothetical protein